MSFSIELESGFLEIIIFVMAIIYTLVPITFFYQFSNGKIRPTKISILGILFLYLNGLTYFITTLIKGINEEREMKLRDFSNLSGAILGFGYCLYYEFIIYYKAHKIKFYIFLGLTFGSIALIILLAKFIDPDLVEYIAVVFNILEYLPLGFNLFYLIKHKIGNILTLFSAIPGIINTICWIIWASLKVHNDGKNKHSLIANILGFLLCLTQIIILFMFESDNDLNEPLDGENNDLIRESKNEQKKESLIDEIL